MFRFYPRRLYNRAMPTCHICTANTSVSRCQSCGRLACQSCSTNGLCQPCSLPQPAAVPMLLPPQPGGVYDGVHSLHDPRFPVKTCPKCSGHRLVYAKFPPRRLELRLAGGTLILSPVFAPLGLLGPFWKTALMVWLMAGFLIPFGFFLIVLSCLLQRGQVRCLGCDFQGEAGP